MAEVQVWVRDAGGRYVWRDSSMEEAALFYELAREAKDKARPGTNNVVDQRSEMRSRRGDDTYDPDYVPGFARENGPGVQITR